MIEPRHGVEPTARQLAETIDRIKAANVNVLFAEKYFASKLVGHHQGRDRRADVFVLAHRPTATYTADLFEREMRENLETLVQAMHDVATKIG